MPPPLVVLLPLMCAVGIIVYFVVAWVIAPLVLSGRISRRDGTPWDTSRSRNRNRWD